MGSSELNGGLDGYAHGDLGREAIDGVFAEVTKKIDKNSGHTHETGRFQITFGIYSSC